MPSVSELEATASPLFDIPAELLKPFLTRGRRREYLAGTVVYRTEEITDGLFYLREGLVKQFISTPSGIEKVIGLVKPDCLFGEALLLNRCPAQSTAVAVLDSTIYVFSRRTMQDLLRTHPDLLFEIARSLSFKIRLLTSQVWVMASEDSTAKIGKVLYLLTRDSPDATQTIHLTHQALADLAGVHRVTASNVLASMVKEGTIESRRGSIVIKQRDRLTKYRLR